MKEAGVREETASEYALQTFEIPEVELGSLTAPEDWNLSSFSQAVQEQRDLFVRNAQTVASQVPTRYLPPDHPDQSTNLLLNPQHPDFSSLRITIEPFKPNES